MFTVDEPYVGIPVEEVKITSPSVAMKHGMAFLTEDRKETGCFLILDVLENMQMAVLNQKFVSAGFVAETALSRAGIEFKRGEELEILDTSTGQIDLAHAPDDINFAVDEFNKRVITVPFNATVAKALAEHIDRRLLQ